MDQSKIDAARKAYDAAVRPAKKAYNALVQKSAATTPRGRTAALKGLAERFEGTHYGQLAQEAAAKKP